MIIDPLKSHTVEEIAALRPTASEALDLAAYYNINRGSLTQEERDLCLANVIAVYKLVPKEEVIRYIDSVTSSKPAEQPQHPFKMPYELDTEA